MAKVRYIGPFQGGVDVVLGGFAGQDAPFKHVEHGDVLETSREHAERLLEQSTNWEPADPPKKHVAAVATEPEREDA